MRSLAIVLVAIVALTGLSVVAAAPAQADGWSVGVGVNGGYGYGGYPSSGYAYPSYYPSYYYPTYPSYYYPSYSYYPAYYYPSYSYYPAYYPSYSWGPTFSFGIGYSSGWGGHHHHH